MKSLPPNCLQGVFSLRTWHFDLSWWFTWVSFRAVKVLKCKWVHTVTDFLAVALGQFLTKLASESLLTIPPSIIIPFYNCSMYGQKQKEHPISVCTWWNIRIFILPNILKTVLRLYLKYHLSHLHDAKLL